jgi:hypothetical protein
MASGCTTLKDYADPGRILVKSSIPFQVSRSPLKNIMGNGKRGTGNWKRISYEYNLRLILPASPKPRLLDMVGY